MPSGEADLKDDRRDELRSVAQLALGRPVIRFTEHRSSFGSSRKGFVAETADARAFLRCAVPGLGLDGTMFSLSREAGILRALSDAGVRVPTPLFVDASGDVVVLEWLDGDTGPCGDRSERGRAAQEYLALIAALGDLDAGSIVASEVEGHATIARAVDTELRRWRAIATKDFLEDPVGAALLAWLEAHRTDDDAPAAVVHGDAGHGNFLVLRGEITGLLDWELCHLGDPVEDIACMQMRSLGRDALVWFDAVRTFCEARPLGLDTRRLGWERVHVLVRSSIAMRRSMSRGNAGRGHAPFARYDAENLFLAMLETAKLAGYGVEPPPDLDSLIREASRRSLPDGLPTRRLVDAGFAFGYPEVSA